MAPNVRKRPEKWRKKNKLLFGLTVAERNPSDSSVISVECLFCQYVGRNAVATGSSSARGGEETRPHIDRGVLQFIFQG